MSKGKPGTAGCPSRDSALRMCSRYVTAVQKAVPRISASAGCPASCSPNQIPTPPAKATASISVTTSTRKRDSRSSLAKVDVVRHSSQRTSRFRPQRKIRMPSNAETMMDSTSNASTGRQRNCSERGRGANMLVFSSSFKMPRSSPST